MRRARAWGQAGFVWAVVCLACAAGAQDRASPAARALEELAALPEAQLDAGAAALLAARAVQPEVDVAAGCKRLDEMAARLAPQLAEERSAEGKLKALAAFVFREEGFSYAWLEPGEESFAQLLERKRGACHGLTALCLALARRTGLPLEMVYAEKHVLCRCVDGAETLYLETTEDGKLYSDLNDVAKKLARRHHAARPEEFVFTPLRPRQVLATFLVQAAQRLCEQGAAATGRQGFERALALWPDLIEAHAGLALAAEAQNDAASAQTHFRRACVLSLQQKSWRRLFWAARAGDPALVTQALDSGARPDAADETGLTPLHLAHSASAAELLLARGASVKAKTRDGHTPLHSAAAAGSAELLACLVTHGADPNAETAEGATPLHLAVLKGHAGAAEQLIAAGADVDAGTASGFRPLHLAAHAGRRALVDLLLKHHADPNKKAQDGFRPLHLAAQAGHADIVRALLEHQAEPDGRADLNFTALHLAAQQGHVEVVRLLLAHGAELDRPTAGGFTPLHLAAQNARLPVVRLLLESRARVDAATRQGATPLHFAVAAGPYAAVQALLARQAPVDAPDAAGRTPLHWAAERGLAETARLLLDTHAAPSRPDRSGATPLHLAAAADAPKAVLALLEHGADVNARDGDDRTPRQCARGEEVKTLLAEHGAKE